MKLSPSLTARILAQSENPRPVVPDLRIELPWPPLANNLHTIARGRKILSAEGRAYPEVVALACVGLGRLEGRLYVQLEVYAPHHRRFDICNAEKAVVDSLVKAGVFPDDSAIDEVRISRMPVESPGRVVVIAWSLEA